jgi:hypothetical protein
MLLQAILIQYETNNINPFNFNPPTLVWTRKINRSNNLDTTVQQTVNTPTATTEVSSLTVQRIIYSIQMTSQRWVLD